jgi:hypothetical protein
LHRNRSSITRKSAAAVLEQRAEFTRLMDIVDQHVRFAIQHFVAALDGELREGLGDVTLARPGGPISSASSRASMNASVERPRISRFGIFGL